MHIRTPKDWELPESAATPERDYQLRPEPTTGRISELSVVRRGMGILPMFGEFPNHGRDARATSNRFAPHRQLGDEPTTPRRDFLRSVGLGLAGAALGPRALLAATGGFPTKVNPDFRDPALKPTAYELITSYNNFYEFGTDKADPRPNANKGWKTEPWTVEVGGLVSNPTKIDVNDLITKLGGIEQRLYRFRCVEAWSMVIPWDGFALSQLIAFAQPKPEAKFLQMTTVLDPRNLPGQRGRALDWPYVEGLRLDEANHELAFIATGIYGKPIPNQNGAPLRLVVPWKYGFKCVKSIVKFDFVAKQPRNTWYVMAPQEYGFYANVNPAVDHPRWSQASERVIGGGGILGSRQKTLPFNGYEQQVAALYKGMDLKKFY